MLAMDAIGPRPAPRVVLLHGWPLDRTIWSAVVPGLASARFRVLAADLPGFGGSPLLEGDATVEAYADAVADGLRREALARAAVAGHSFGGYVALALADRHPDLVAGLGLIASRAIPDSDAARRGRQEAIEKVRAQGTAALLPGLAEKLLGPHADATWRERAASLIARARPEGVVAGLAAMARRPDRTRVLDAFPGPVLVVHGTADVLVPVTEAAEGPGSGRRFAAILPDIGHMPMWEAPKATARALRGWADAALRRASARENRRETSKVP